MRSLVLASLLFAACASEQAYPVQGRIVGFSDDGRTVFVDHEDIPRFMEAMTMPFKLKEGLVLDSTMQVGDAVGFELHVTPTGSWIDDLKRISDAEVNVSPSGENHRSQPTQQVAAAAIGERVPGATLTDHTGQPFTLDAWQGQAIVVSFIYTRCPLPDYCPALTARVAELVEPLTARAPGQVRLLTVTLDPTYDTPERLADFRRRFTTAPDSLWRFATGTPAEIERLVSVFGVFSKASGPATIDHSLVTALITPDRHLRRVWRDAKWAPAEVVQEVLQTLPGGR